MSDVATEETAAGPSFELGSVNVDSLKEILDNLGATYPWQDEVSKLAYHEQVASLDKAGDPHAVAEEETAEGNSDSDKDAEIAALKAQLAAATAPPAQ
jgi:hypothetical protein